MNTYEIKIDLQTEVLDFVNPDIDTLTLVVDDTNSTTLIVTFVQGSLWNVKELNDDMSFVFKMKDAGEEVHTISGVRDENAVNFVI